MVNRSSGFIASYGFGWVATQSEGRLSSVYGDGSAGKIVTSYRDSATLSDKYATWQGTQTDYGHIYFTAKVPMVVSYTFSNGATTINRTLTTGQGVNGATNSAVLTIVELL